MPALTPLGERKARPASRVGPGFWRAGGGRLDRMGPGELVAAYLLHPAVWAYAGLLAVAATVAVAFSTGPAPARLVQLGLPALAAVLLYPLAEYLLHRFLLHGRWLYRSPLTVGLWKRIHYDHHADPHDLQVLFGALYTTLPVIAAVTLPVGLALGGRAGAAAAFGAGVACMLVYEFCHCMGHLAYTPRSRTLQRLKRLHLLHHFHNERGNFGITGFLVDRLAGTYYDHPGRVPRSDTVFNLGYGEEERRRFPWLARRAHGPGPAPGSAAAGPRP